jgi:hypothetical protein
MKDWLQENPGGSKDAFEHYFKALPADVKKVRDRHFLSVLSPHVLISTCTQTYKDRAAAAVCAFLFGIVN